MILAIIGWIGLFTLCQCKVILVSNESNNSVDCCTSGSKECLCSSFIDALNHLENDTTIEIILPSVTLHNFTEKEHLNDVKIIGNGATVMCNHTGGIQCTNCSNVILQGIIWDQCTGIIFNYTNNITISLCTFQFSNACASVAIVMISGNVLVQRCQFLFNYVDDISGCTATNGLLVSNDNYYSVAQSIFLTVYETMFYHNGILGDESYITVFIRLSNLSEASLVMYNSTVSLSSGLGGYFLLENNTNSTILFNNTVFMDNRHGGAEFKITNLIPDTTTYLVVLSSAFVYNINGSLKVIIAANDPSSTTHVLLANSIMKGNVGTFSRDSSIGSDSYDQGTGILLWFRLFNAIIEISFCNISNNDGSSGSIVYIKDLIGSDYYSNLIVISSSTFTSNQGSALYLLHCNNVVFGGYSSFVNNSAQSGAAIYLAQNSQAMIGENVALEFVNNTASLFGGAVYVSVPFECLHQGIAFTHLPNNSNVSFVNNSAEIAGNSLYFSISGLCNIIRNSSDSHSVVYIPYQFTYVPLPDSVILEISTSPYAVNLCSTECSTSKSSCFVADEKMLGQTIYLNATVCDYYNNVSEAVQFFMECVDCDGQYRLSDSIILLHSGLSKFAVLAIDADSDLSTNRNITINMTSVLYEYKQLSASISVTMSPCHSGYIFDTSLQQCKCYDHNQDIIQCQQDYAEIKYGYWFGRVSPILHTTSLCPTYYCDFSKRVETRAGYYNLPSKESDQCNLHRVGMACGMCAAGYTLAYDSTDCINESNCTPGITILVLILTILYWIAIVAVIFGLMYLKSNISLGYVYGILFYYSIVDILLGSNLYISVGVFQLTTILSSFAKVTPQFLGKLCFVKGLSGIDQQFIHYAHALAVFLLTIAIILAARWSMKIASLVSQCVIRVICLLFLLAYTSLASTSLHLLRPLIYNDSDDTYVYFSPSIKYFRGRHVAYGITACGCGVFIVIGFPLLLFLQPFLRGKVNFIKIKPLLDQFQGCYKSQYHYFAAYYLVCRLVIIGIAFANNFKNALFYLQTAGIIIVMIHIWIQPYKSDTLNVLDGIILLTMILTINLSSYTFISSTTTLLVIALVIFPLGFSLGIFAFFSSAKFLSNQKQKRCGTELHDVLRNNEVKDGLNDNVKASPKDAEISIDDATASVDSSAI